MVLRGDTRLRGGWSSAPATTIRPPTERDQQPGHERRRSALLYLRLARRSGTPAEVLRDLVTTCCSQGDGAEPLTIAAPPMWRPGRRGEGAEGKAAARGRREPLWRCCASAPGTTQYAARQERSAMT